MRYMDKKKLLKRLEDRIEELKVAVTKESKPFMQKMLSDTLHINKELYKHYKRLKFNPGR